ncbi:MAG: hypothetical protein ACP5N7_01025 [Candidatus Pacearchaeota archaeon]
MHEETKKEIVIQTTQEISISENGDIQARTLTELYRVSNMLCRSGILPKAYDTPEKVATAITLARELGLMPLSALKNIAVINGSPSIWGELPLGIIRNSGLLEKINEFCIDKDYKQICFENKNIEAEIFAAICIIKRKNEDERSFHYSQDDVAKHPNCNNQVWKSYKSIMMKRRARAIALKDVFGDLLGGVSIAEYDHDTIPTIGQSINTKRMGAIEKAQAIEDLNNLLKE